MFIPPWFSLFSRNDYLACRKKIHLAQLNYFIHSEFKLELFLCGHIYHTACRVSDYLQCYLFPKANNQVVIVSLCINF